MTIQCDVDGVLNNLMDVVIETFNDRYGYSYTVNDITAYDVANCFELTQANLIKKIFEEPDIWDKVKPLPGAQEGLQKLMRDGNTIYIVTNNSPYTYGQKFDWIRTYFPFIESSKIICMSDKWLLNTEVMIEDCYETLIARPYYTRILMDQSWNQETEMKDWTYGITRCYNWDDVVEAVNKIKMESDEN